MPDQLNRGSIPHLKEKSVRPSKDFTHFGITNSKGGVLPQSLALKIIFPDNTQKAINYHEIASPMLFDGKNRIELSTSTLSIIIEGNYLEKLFDYLLEQAVVWIKSPDETITENLKGGVLIESIEVKDKE